MSLDFTSPATSSNVQDSAPIDQKHRLSVLPQISNSSSMASDTSTRLPAGKTSPIDFSLADVSDCFTNRQAWGFRPVPGGPDIIMSDTATEVTGEDLVTLRFTADACATALGRVQETHKIESETQELSEVQRKEFEEIATKYMIHEFKKLRNGEESSRYHVLDSDTWARLVGDGHQIIRTVPKGWTEPGRVVTEAWERYEAGRERCAEADLDASVGSDEGQTYEDALESQEDSSSPSDRVSTDSLPHFMASLIPIRPSRELTIGRLRLASSHCVGNRSKRT
jgi:hypothetical protein